MNQFAVQWALNLLRSCGADYAAAQAEVTYTLSRDLPWEAATLALAYYRAALAIGGDVRTARALLRARLHPAPRLVRVD